MSQFSITDSSFLHWSATSSVALTDVADIVYEDSPSTLRRNDKEYRVTISGEYTEQASGNTRQSINAEVVSPNLPYNVSIAKNSRDQSQAEEFASLFQAIALAVFLILHPVSHRRNMEPIKLKGIPGNYKRGIYRAGFWKYQAVH